MGLPNCRKRAALAGGLSLFASLCSAANTPLPALDGAGRAGFADYLGAAPHRAFAIAPGGTWTWRAEQDSPEAALEAALADCRRRARSACVAYAIDGQLLFDARQWARAWRPYADGLAASRAAEGVAPGMRFPDLAYRDAQGRATRLSAGQGRIRVVHFWGSWCPPCQREMPELARLHAELGGESQLQFLFIPVREEASRARAWLKQRGLRVPLADAGGPAGFPLADGRTLPDRNLAPVFPTTFVLDRHGLVLFAHAGPVADWASLAPLLRDALAHAPGVSGR
ncbi:MAG: TlpA disulfide reductase family protein [Pseudomonadota bacterium]